MLEIIRIALLAALCVGASITDLWKGKIYNWMTFPVMLAGLIIGFLQGGTNGLIFSALGLAAGLGLFILGFIWGGIGAGDIKMLMALGTLTGPIFLLYSLVYTIAAALIFSLILYAMTGRLKYLFKNVKLFFQRAYLTRGKDLDQVKMEKSIEIRFGIFIGAGFIFRLFEEWNGWNILNF